MTLRELARQRPDLTYEEFRRIWNLMGPTALEMSAKQIRAFIKAIDDANKEADRVIEKVIDAAQEGRDPNVVLLEELGIDQGDK